MVRSLHVSRRSHFSPLQVIASGIASALSPVLGQVSDAANYKKCVGYLEELLASLGGASSIEDVKAVAYEQYTSYPSGPYVFCWENVHGSTDDIGNVTLAIHPYVPRA